MGRCRCDPLSVAGCQCSVADSNCIDVSGSGTAASPFSFAPIIDPSTDNLLTCGAAGLLATLPSPLSDPPRARVTRTTDFAVAQSTFTIVPWQAEDYDKGAGGGMWAVGNPSRLTAPLDGLYAFSFAVGWDTNPGDTRYTEQFIHSADGALGNFDQGETLVGFGRNSVGYLEYEMTAGEYMEFRVRQTGAVSLNVISSVETHFAGRWVAEL